MLRFFYPITKNAPAVLRLCRCKAAGDPMAKGVAGVMSGDFVSYGGFPPIPTGKRGYTSSACVTNRGIEGGRLKRVVGVGR